MDEEPQMNKTIKQSLGEFGSMLAMRPQGRRVQEALDARLRELPSGGVLVIDFDGVEMMDYSFADEALGTIYSRMAPKSIPTATLCWKYAKTNSEKRCWKTWKSRSTGAKWRHWCCRARMRAAAPKPRPSPGRDAKSSPWRVVGTLPGHLIDTLKAVMDKGQITVRELACMLGLDSATACNNRIARLYQLHLVRREATVVPEGGRQYSYSAVV
jgi:hypothetical protein